MNKPWIQVTAIHGTDKRKELVDRHTIKRVIDYGDKRHILFNWIELTQGATVSIMPTEHLWVAESVEELQQLMNQ
jgi:hypothetical protein